jgi:hypothetical protein
VIHNSLITGILNQISPGNMTQIELRAGQIIKGTVLKLYPDNHAAVQLGGITVTAKLKTPLEIGQKTWLQVQPGAGPVTLKVITRPNEAGQASEGTIEGLTKALGIKSTPANVGLLSKVLQANIPVKPEDMKTLLQAAGQAGHDPETVNAAVTALQKGLPLTKETLLALRTFIENKSVASMVNRLLTDTRSLLQSADINKSPELKTKVQEFYRNLQNVKSAFAEFAASVAKGESAAKSVAGSPHHAGSQLDKPQNGQPELVHPETVGKQQNALQQQTVSRRENVAEPTATVQNHPIQELFNRLGVNHEIDAFRSMNADATSPHNSQMENLKASVLQLLEPAEANSIPQELKGQMQSLVQHITGQQLMIAQPPDSPFIQLMLQMPMPGVQNANAVIQLESRQKGKGTVDPDNCRLFFYLSMDNLGETMLDVSIVNKILSISIYNNRAELTNLVQATRPELEKELADKGYRLSSVRVIPVKDEKQASAKIPQKTRYSTDLTGYKGVDFRI